MQIRFWYAIQTDKSTALGIEGIYYKKKKPTLLLDYLSFY
jgi:hypothetical protein